MRYDKATIGKLIWVVKICKSVYFVVYRKQFNLNFIWLTDTYLSIEGLADQIKIKNKKTNIKSESLKKSQLRMDKRR
jgi:hypothetical protein